MSRLWIRGCFGASIWALGISGAKSKSAMKTRVQASSGSECKGLRGPGVVFEGFN